MTRSRKNQGKKRLLLDEEELKPKTNPWDFFYGKVGSTGAKLSPSLPPLSLPQTDEHSAALPEDTENLSDVSPIAEHSLRISDATSKGGDAVARSKPEPHREFQSPRLGQITPRNSKSEPPDITPISSKPENSRTGPQASTSFSLNSFSIEDSSLIGLTFEDFERAFKRMLTKADIKVCRIVFEQTYALGLETCILRAEDLAEAVGISRRHLFRVLSELENTGFIKRGGIYNTPTKKGIEISFYPIPRLKKPDIARQFHYYDSE